MKIISSKHTHTTYWPRVCVLSMSCVLCIHMLYIHKIYIQQCGENMNGRRGERSKFMTGTEKCVTVKIRIICRWLGEEEEGRGQIGSGHIHVSYMCIGKITKQLFIHIDMLDKQVTHAHTSWVTVTTSMPPCLTAFCLWSFYALLVAPHPHV